MEPITAGILGTTPHEVEAGNYRHGMELVRIGIVESTLVDAAPRQGDEGSPDAWIVIDERFAGAARDIAAGDELILVTWLDRADRAVLAVHPRDDPDRPVTGVFSTRSPDRPNPLGLHTVTVLAVDGRRLRVRDLEAFDGTPVVDVKPVLRPLGQR